MLSDGEDLEEWLHEVRRRWLIRVGSGGAAAAAAGALLQWRVYRVPAATAALLAIVVPLLAVALYSVRGRRHELAFHAIGASFVFGVGLMSYSRGGFQVLLMLYLFVLPLGALMLRLRRAAVVWVIGVFALSLTLYGLQVAGLAPEPVPPRSLSELLSYLGILGVLTAAGAVGIHNLESRERAVTRIERELSRQRRLESLGRLAGGVAHDFNNLLAIIRASAEDETSWLDSRGLVLEAVDRGAGLTRSLLSAARDPAEVGRRSDAAAVLAQTAALLERVLPETIALRVELGSDVDTCGDPRELGHAILNLCLNARDAMPQGGTLALRCDRITIEDPAARGVQHGSLRAGDYVRILVDDEGHGIAPDELELVFAPFTTTKADGAGAGLGLFRVRELVERLGGAIGLRSAPGEGTRIALYLPPSGPPSVAPPPLEADEAAGARGVRVLLVEDEAGVRRALARMLRASGVEVVTASGPEEALTRWREAEHDVVLSDVLMPQMTGPRLVRELRDRGFEGRVVLMTGYSRSELEGVNDLVLQKPVPRDALLRAILGSEPRQGQPAVGVVTGSPQQTS